MIMTSNFDSENLIITNNYELNLDTLTKNYSKYSNEIYSIFQVYF